MKEIKWRFPGNNYGEESGLDTPAMETFKKDPVLSLARELCQNSIDARDDKSKPVLIEFASFNIEKEKIPDIHSIEKEINSCLNYRRNKYQKMAEQLMEMQDALSNKYINCLRISDKNTTGLRGVSGKITDFDRTSSPWYLITKGSGISSKTGNTGGSKGIGKFANFVVSKFNTVFYSTKTIHDEEGYEGIIKLCSSPIGNSGELTQGTGYYSIDDMHNPINGQLHIDPSFKRGATEYGTDVYILGFKNERDWDKAIISKIIESFIYAIWLEELIVKVNDVEISKSTLHEIVYSDKQISSGKIQRSIISQYKLLTDSDVHKATIEIDDLGEVELLVKYFGKDEEKYATKECVMVRYPYMKIKNINVSGLSCSAMCIIKNNKLNTILRDIENPQHTDWEPNHISDPSKRREVNEIIRALIDKVKKEVANYLSKGDSYEIDIEGAGEYLPDINQNGDNKIKNKKILENISVSKIIKNKIKETNPTSKDDLGNIIQPDLGEHIDGDGSPVPDGLNNSKGGGPRFSDKEEGYADGKNEVFKYHNLTGIIYRFFVVDKNIGHYVIVFDSPYNQEGCNFELYALNDEGKRKVVNIHKCILNGTSIDIVDNRISNFNLSLGKKYRFDLYTNQVELFSSEVKLYAYR